jgi:hypothetical protein
VGFLPAATADPTEVDDPELVVPELPDLRVAVLEADGYGAADLRACGHVGGARATGIHMGDTRTEFECSSVEICGPHRG